MVGLLVDKYKYSLEEATEIGIRLEEMVWLLDQSQSDSYRSMVDEVVNSLQRKQLSRQKLSRTTAQNKPGETLLDILTGD
jgi:phosphotransacetylase